MTKISMPDDSTDNTAAAAVVVEAKAPNDAPDNTTVTISTTTGTEDNNKKRSEHRGNNRRNNNNQSSKKRKNMDRNDHTWQDNNANNNNRNDTNGGNQRRGGGGGSSGKVHPGSYANPAMREMFGVTLPPHLLVSATDDKSVETAGDTPNNNNDHDGSSQRKFSKKKVAFLLAYLGSGYAGFQSNEGQRTLQAEFELALVKAGFLNPLNMGYFHKYSWSTSGRTDKGVHACAQVCSAKIQVLPDQTLNDVRELINAQLPSQTFRVLDVVKATKSFCAKTGRSRVRYQYMIPSFCFFGRDQLRDVMKQIAPITITTNNNSEQQEEEERHKGVPLSEREVKMIQDHIKNYRVKPEQLESLQSALKRYEGTHSFHNFTKGLTSKDASATRYILSFNVEEPVVFENGMEWIPTQVVGQSFLLHQIRKMISLGVDAVRMNLPDLVSIALDKRRRIRTNLAPAQGLFLEMSFYDAYNEKMKYHSDTDAEELDWSTEGTPASQRWKKFRNGVIMEHVVKEEEQEGNFVQYLYNQEFFFDHIMNYELPSSDKDQSIE